MPQHIERSLLAYIVSYDLNLNKKPALTIAKRFARENTNDLGDNLNISTSDIVILELKKYMFLNFLEIFSQSAS